MVDADDLLRAPLARQILVVDDMPANRKLLRVTLEAAGYEVVEAGDGIEALAALNRHPVYAVISDILMPNMDGYRLCHEIRQSTRWRELPFIFYSSTYRSSSDEKLAREMGGDKFISKPASAEAITGALLEVLKAKRGPVRQPVTVQGELHLMKQYSERLVSKLEEQNNELHNRTLDLEREIVERRHADERVRAREQQLRLFVEHSPAAVAMLDRDMRYLVASYRWLSDYRLGDRSLVGRSHYEVFPEIPDRWKEIHQRCLAGAVEKSDADEFPRADGLHDWVRWEVRPWRTEQGDIGGLIIFSEVITERIRAQQELQRASERLRELARRLADAQDEEQRHLSIELHDRIGQSLTALGLNLNIVTAALLPDSAARVGERLQESRRLVEDTMASVRNLIAELRPAALDSYGLLAGLRWFAQQLQVRAGISTEVVGQEPEPRLAAPVEGALFRIAQEALNNTVKHGQARSARIELNCGDGRVALVIADDGVGFDVAHPSHNSHSHWGLTMMRERAEAAGARLRVESAVGAGTRVEVELPKPP